MAADNEKKTLDYALFLADLELKRLACLKVAHNHSAASLDSTTCVVYDRRMKRERSRKRSKSKRRVRNAASLLGAASWRSRVKRHGIRKLREHLTNIGGHGGRPRKTPLNPAFTGPLFGNEAIAGNETADA